MSCAHRDQLGAGLIVVGCVLVIAAVTHAYAVLSLLAVGGVVLCVGIGLVSRDVLGDHPDEADARERDELQHRRGAGWEKPVRPPSGKRPGGLPPRKG